MPLKQTDIPEFSPDLPDDQKEEVLRTAIKQISGAMAQTGANLLVSDVITSSVATTAATPTIVPTFSRAFVTSGGLVDIEFKSSITVSAGTARVALQVDGQDKDIVGLTTAGTLLLKAKLNLPGGQHSISIIGSSGGTLTFGANSSTTGIWIEETLL